MLCMFVLPKTNNIFSVYFVQIVKDVARFSLLPVEVLLMNKMSCASPDRLFVLGVDMKRSLE